MHLAVLREVGGEALCAACFPQVVQLGLQRLGELVDQAHQVVVGARLPAPAGVDGEVAQDLQVLGDLLHDTRATHLDHYLAAVVQRRGVRLSDRPGGQGNGLEIRERFLYSLAELLGDEVAHGVARNEWGGVLELGQLGLVVGAQQIGARREYLSELDERRGELLERQAHVLGLRVGLRTTLVAE